MDKLSFTIYSLATDFSWDTHHLFLYLVDKKNKSFNYDKDDRRKARLRLMFSRRLVETPLGPVQTVDEVLTQLIDDIRAIMEEFDGPNEPLLSIFIILVERVRPQMREIVEIRKWIRNAAPDPNLHQRTASIFRQLFFKQLIIFLSFYRRRWSMEYIRHLDKLAADLSWHTHSLFFVIVEEKRKNLHFDTDNSSRDSLVDALYKTRLRNMFMSRLETRLGPVHSVDQVLPQLIADIRAILEEFDGPNEPFMLLFRSLVQRLRPEMFEIVRIHEVIGNGDPEPKLHQRAASRFRKMFFAELIIFLSLPGGIN